MKMRGRLISLILSVAVIICSLSVVAFAEDTVLAGDVDGNGKLETEDARVTLCMAAGIVEPDYDVADMDGDGVVSVNDVIAVLKAVANLESGGIVVPDKNGDNELSDRSDNEFIKLISSRFGVKAESLVAIYSVPDSGTNYVLQFKKSLVGNTYKKSPDNLERVYHIGKAPEREISYTNGKMILGDHYNCEAAEGVLVFNLVQTKVMQQYPDYFEDVN